MSRVLPIIFNTENVCAILSGRKCETRRALKYNFIDVYGWLCYSGLWNEGYTKIPEELRERYVKHLAEKPPYQVGDILYVRETWKYYEKAVGCGEQFYVKQYFAYKADEDNWEVQKPSEWYEGKWRPAIHMPKKAARLWLKVTNVRLEHLRDITEDGAEKEGCVNTHGLIRDPESEYNVPLHTAKEQFVDVWNRTVPKEKQADLDWEANPWVWVFQFERCKKPDESSDHRTPSQAT